MATVEEIQKQQAELLGRPIREPFAPSAPSAQPVPTELTEDQKQTQEALDFISDKKAQAQRELASWEVERKVTEISTKIIKILQRSYIVLKIKGEEAFFGEIIDASEEFIEELCERINTVYSTMMEEGDKMNQLAFITTFLISFKGRLNRVCEKI